MAISLTIDGAQVALKKGSKEPSVAINTVADDLGIKRLVYLCSKSTA